MPRAKKPVPKIPNVDGDDILVGGSFYKGNENLLSKNAKLAFTEEMLAEMNACKKSILHFAERHFTIITEEGEEVIKLRKFQKQLLKNFKDCKRNIVLSSRQSGKALELNTPIPTPNGFTAIGDLKDGDVVYSETGLPCNVIKAHDVMYNRECYKISFDNGESIIADGDHLWFTQTKSDRRKSNNRCGSVKTTKSILDNMLDSSGEPNHRIPMCLNGVEYSEKLLPIDPYILGFWLGDGSSDSSRITVGSRDVEDILRNLKNSKDFDAGSIKEYKKGTYTINITNTDVKKCLFKKLKENSLINNKHIPEIYLTSSREQRIELIKGLMDSDGYITKTGHAYFYNTNLSLVKDVQNILLSLGYKTNYKEKIAKINGRACGICGSVYFKPRELVTTIKFKTDRLLKNISTPSQSLRNQFHYIKNIERVESVPVRCITVDSPNSLYLCGKSFIPTHNTTVVTAYALWKVCFFEHQRIAIIANKGDTAQQIFERIRTSFENMPIYLKPAIKSWRKNGFDLSNGSSITIASTSASSLRGRPLNCVSGDSVVTIRDKDTMKTFDIEISDLYSLLESTENVLPDFIILE